MGYDVSTFYFAQTGEDAILVVLFREKIIKKERGFFIDIGAHHPFEGSNTYLLYLNGWRGINVDASPGSMKLFRHHRPEDINLEVGVGAKRGTFPFYMSEVSLMNTFSKENLSRLHSLDQIKKETQVEVYPLAEILDKYVTAGQKIDLLTVDVEGLDFDVLKSNNWIKYRPSVVVVELPVTTLRDTLQNEATRFMMDLGYEAVGKTVVGKEVASVFFVDTAFSY